MTSLTKSWHVDWHWYALLSITFLINVPMLSPALLMCGDVLHAFIFFAFAYGELLFHHELPRWSPYLGFGTVVDFNLLDSIRSTDYVMMALGWLCGCKNVLLLYKISLILSQAVLVLGLYLLARKFFTSMLTVWLVCMGGLLTTNFYVTSPWSLTVYYMVPLVLWFVLRFLESRNPAHLWLAGLTEGLSLLGTVSYIAPLHLFIVVAFLVPFLCRDPELWRAFVNWRNFVHPLFFACCGYFLLIGLWIAGIDVVWTSPGRDAASGNVALDVFLGKDKDFARQPLGVMLRTFVKGDLYYGEYVNYVGILPLATLVYALLRRRDTPFLSVAVVALALYWFALGGWFSTLTYYFFPLMNKFRFISAAWNFQRLFLLLLGGFGFDQFLRDLRGTEGRPAEVFSQRARWTIVIVLTCCVLDQLVHWKANFDSSADFFFQGQFWPELFTRQNTGVDLAGLELPQSIVLMLRYLAYAVIFGLVWLLLVRRKSEVGGQSRRWIQAVGPVLFTLYLLDVGFFFSQYVKQCPWCPPGTPVEDALTVRELIYRPRRYELDQVQLPFVAASTLGLTGSPQELGPWQAVSARMAGRLNKLPDDADRIRQVLVCRRGGADAINFYGSAGVLMQADLVLQRDRLDVLMTGVMNMMLARKKDKEYPINAMVRDVALRRSFGEGLDKARMVRDRDVVFAGSEREALVVFRKLANPDRQIVIEGPGPAAPRQETGADECAGRVEPKLFTANRVVFKIPAGEGEGWLLYADAYAPAWKAHVDGKPARVLRANLGFKAVWVPQGASEVAFFFDAGRRDLHFLAFVAVSALLGFALVALLLAAPWVLTIGPERISARNPQGSEYLTPGLTQTKVDGQPNPASLGLLRIGSALAWLATLAGGLFLYVDLICVSLLIVAAAALVVFIVHNRVAKPHGAKG